MIGLFGQVKSNYSSGNRIVIICERVIMAFLWWKRSCGTGGVRVYTGGVIMVVEREKKKKKVVLVCLRGVDNHSLCSLNC